jgi:hypothetical protein
LDPNKEIERLEKKLSQSIGEKWDIDEKLIDEEELRLRRMDEIWQEANDLRVARCEAKMAEVGREKFMEMIHSGDWSDYEGRTEIEHEYWRLWNEQFNVDWLRDHGKPYAKEDDPQAKF